MGRCAGVAFQADGSNAAMLLLCVIQLLVSQSGSCRSLSEMQVHTLATALLLDPSEVHFFDEIGYEVSLLPGTQLPNFNSLSVCKLALDLLP